jgi:hypothetical protein
LFPCTCMLQPYAPTPQLISCSNSPTISASRREGYQGQGTGSHGESFHARERAVRNEHLNFQGLGSSAVFLILDHLGRSCHFLTSPTARAVSWSFPRKSCLRSQDLVLESLYYHTHIKADQRTDPRSAHRTREEAPFNQ